MGDLISRSELVYKIRGIVPGSQDVDFIVELIQNQPTAYDVEKVVGELERNRSVFEKQNVLPLVNMDYAVDVVKRGGVE